MGKTLKISIVLFFFLFTISPVYSQEITPLQEEQTSTSQTLTANSVMPIYSTYSIGKKPLKYPDRIRFELIKPDGSKAYVIDTTTKKIVDKGDYWLVTIEDPLLRVPAFPTQGQWRLELTFYNKIWIIENYLEKHIYRYNVGESSLMENLQAPIYIHADGILGIGEMNMELPCLLILTIPLWLVAVAIIVLNIWKIGLITSISILKSKKIKEVKK
ncbi:MAG: hypothetical protein DRM98_00315 [Thermoplasmata archaeon]|nr:MAG: hypothetical protein DRM98_00315 [Thermoplasmata archaeon]